MRVRTSVVDVGELGRLVDVEARRPIALDDDARRRGRSGAPRRVTSRRSSRGRVVGGVGGEVLAAVRRTRCPGAGRSPRPARRRPPSPRRRAGCRSTGSPTPRVSTKVAITCSTSATRAVFSSALSVALRGVTAATTPIEENTSSTTSLGRDRRAVVGPAAEVRGRRSASASTTRLCRIRTPAGRTASSSSIACRVCASSEVRRGDGHLDHAGEADVVLGDPDVLVADALDRRQRADDGAGRAAARQVEGAAGPGGAARRRSRSARRTPSVPGWSTPVMPRIGRWITVSVPAAAMPRRPGDARRRPARVTDSDPVRTRAASRSSRR